MPQESNQEGGQVMSWQAHRWQDDNNRRPYREAESTHHRRPRSLGGDNSERNLIELPRSRHCAWHTLFQNWTPERIADEINNRYLDPDVKFVAVPADMVIELQRMFGQYLPAKTC